MISTNSTPLNSSTFLPQAVENLAELANFFEKAPRTVEKKQSGGYCPRAFRNNKRTNENALPSPFIAFDVDSGQTRNDALALLAERKCAYVLHRTHSYSSQTPRFRVLLQLETPAILTRDQMRTIGDAIGLEYDRNALDAARFFYLPPKAAEINYAPGNLIKIPAEYVPLSNATKTGLPQLDGTYDAFDQAVDAEKLRVFMREGLIPSDFTDEMGEPFGLSGNEMWFRVASVVRNLLTQQEFEDWLGKSAKTTKNDYMREFKAPAVGLGSVVAFCGISATQDRTASQEGQKAAAGQICPYDLYTNGDEAEWTIDAYNAEFLRKTQVMGEHASLSGLGKLANWAVDPEGNVYFANKKSCLRLHKAYYGAFEKKAKTRLMDHALPVAEVALKLGAGRVYQSNNGPVLNTWLDRRVKPKKGSEEVEKLVDDYLRKCVYKGLCNGRKAEYSALMGFVASKFISPEKRLHVSPIIYGDQGIGKDFLFTLLGRCLGDMAVEIRRAEDLLTRFNEHIARATFIHGSEIAIRSLHDSNRLKALITSDRLQVDVKFAATYYVTPCFDIAITTNEAHALRAEKDNRRYLVLNATPAGKSFLAKNASALLQPEAIAAFANRLKNWEIPKGNYQQVIAGLGDTAIQRQQSLDDVEAYASLIVSDGIPTKTVDIYTYDNICDKKIPTRRFFDGYVLACKEKLLGFQGNYISNERGFSIRFGNIFKDVIKKERCREGDKFFNQYEFPEYAILVEALKNAGIEIED